MCVKLNIHKISRVFFAALTWTKNVEMMSELFTFGWASKRDSGEVKCRVNLEWLKVELREIIKNQIFNRFSLSCVNFPVPDHIWTAKATELSSCFAIYFLSSLFSLLSSVHLSANEQKCMNNFLHKISFRFFFFCKNS